MFGNERMNKAASNLHSSYKLGLILVTASAIAWSTAGLFTRLISIDTWSMLFWRGFFGAIGVFAVIVILQGKPGLTDFKRLGWPGWAFAIISAAGMLCFIFSLRITTVAHVSIIYATVPLVAAGLAWAFMKERPTSSAVIASLFALIGVGVMVGFGLEGNLFGDLLAFGMTLVMAIMMVISRKYQNIPIMPAACLSALLSGLVAIPMCEGLSLDANELGLVALFGLVNSAIGLSLFTLGARMLPAIETALIGALDAPLAPIWVWLMFSETPSLATLIGGVIVFAAVGGHLIGSNVKQKKGA
jgi:drug/metabolite transporter (DMT)-like permease